MKFSNSFSASEFVIDACTFFEIAYASSNLVWLNIARLYSSWIVLVFAADSADLSSPLSVSDIFVAYSTVKNPQQQIPWATFKNGSSHGPRVGSLLVWTPSERYTVTGHVAVVTEVIDGALRIAEQNYDNQCWPAGQNWSRELKTRRSWTGRYYINDPESEVWGWKNL